MGHDFDASQIDADAGYEHRDVSNLGITVTTLLIIGLVAFFIVFLDTYFVMTREQIMTSDNGAGLAQREAFEQRDREALTTYKALDGGRYRIPIERAMELEAKESAAP